MKKMKPGDNLGAGELLLKLECSGTAWPKRQHLIRDQNEAKPALFRASAKAQRRDSRAGYDRGRGHHFRGGAWKGLLQTEAPPDPEPRAREPVPRPAALGVTLACG